MASYKFEDLQPEYSELWAKARIKPDWKNPGDAMARRIIAARPQYEPIEAATGVPWWVIGVIHAMEANLNFGCHLHNGDSLRARTWQVPKGRPLKGKPPFTFQESAIDALVYQGFDKIKEWGPARLCFALELYNGMGYRMRGVPSAYLWSGTDQYARGKYVADGVWSATAVSQQLGGMTILKCLDELEDSINLDPNANVSPPAKEWPRSDTPQVAEAASASTMFSLTSTTSSAANVNALAAEGSRLAQTFQGCFRWFWRLLFGSSVAGGTVATMGENSGSVSALRAWASANPFLFSGITALIIVGVGYAGLWLLRKYFLTAAEDNRYSPRGMSK